MIIELFELKSEMQREGILMMDFLENNFEVNYLDDTLLIERIILIEERHLCRPDLISWESYNNVNYVDIILKFNQISNPFSMNLYDLILIPNIQTAINFYKRNKLTTEKLIKDTKALFLDPTKASKKDIARLEQLKKISARRQNGSTEIKPTNLLRNSEVPFSTDGNRIIFSPSNSLPINN